MLLGATWLSTGLRPPSSVGEEAVVRLASEIGCDGVAIGDGCTLPIAATLVPRVMHAGLRVGAVAAPLPERAPAPRKRLPRLSAGDRDERAAAIELASRACALAGSVGAPMVVLEMGALPLAVRWTDLARHFRCRALAEGDAGEAALMAALGERRATVGLALDGCRWSLDALVREAERRQLRLAISLSGTPWGVPSPREGLELAVEYDRARVGLVLDPARLSVLRRLGLAISGERLASLRAAAALIVESEAVGIEAGYLPGLGERDVDLAARDGVAEDTTSVLLGRPDSTDAEVAAAASSSRSGSR
jgi:sugar phosphate isomerase/epimerase